MRSSPIVIQVCFPIIIIIIIPDIGIYKQPLERNQAHRLRIVLKVFLANLGFFLWDTWTL